MHDEARSRRIDLLSMVAIGQGGFYLVTGIWPLLSIRSFEWVTGPKRDRWLVKTVGVLIAVIGGVTALAGQRKCVTPEIALLAGGSAAGLATIDVVYVRRGRIRPIYLLDAISEVGLIVAWLLAWRADPKGTA
jgi:hypothetical protein